MVDQQSPNPNGEWFINSIQGNIKDKYHFVSKLASGAFGIVYLAEERATGTPPY